jgi:hypothetical protein
MGLVAKICRYNLYLCIRVRYPRYPYPCPVPTVFVSVLGYRRINGYTGTNLRRADHLYFGKNLLYPYPYPPTREIQISKISPSSHQINTRTRRKKKKTETEKKQKHKKKYPRTCTPYPCRGTRVPETGTGMKRVGYSFEKKICLPVPAVPVYPQCPCPPYPPRLYPAHARGTR